MISDRDSSIEESNAQNNKAGNAEGTATVINMPQVNTTTQSVTAEVVKVQFGSTQVVDLLATKEPLPKITVEDFSEAHLETISIKDIGGLNTYDAISEESTDCEVEITSFENSYETSSADESDLTDCGHSELNQFAGVDADGFSTMITHHGGSGIERALSKLYLSGSLASIGTNGSSSDEQEDEDSFEQAAPQPVEL